MSVIKDELDLLAFFLDLTSSGRVVRTKVCMAILICVCNSRLSNFTIVLDVIFDHNNAYHFIIFCVSLYAQHRPILTLENKLATDVLLVAEIGSQ